VIGRRTLVAAGLALAAAPTLARAQGAVRTVVDVDGRAVKIADAARVVSVGGSVTETVFELGVGDRLVGVDTTSIFPWEQTSRIAKVGYMRQVAAEGVLSVRPSLILATKAAGPPAAFDQLREAGVPVLMMSDDYTFDSMLAKIRDAGAALGREAEAKAMIERKTAEMAAVRATLQRAKASPKVLFLLGIGAGAPQAAGRKTGADGVIALAGGANVMNGYDGYKPLSLEGTVAAAPDVIVTTVDTVERAGGPDKLLQHPALKLTPAAAAKRVHGFNAQLLLSFGPRTPQAVAMLAQALHPELDFGPLAR
jgi:iron complex transport system substrate-binding protein